MSTGNLSSDWLARLGNVDDALGHLRDPDVVTDIYTAQAVKTLAVELGKLQGERLDEGQCCAQACPGGACETCQCCSAGWCVTGIDGLPKDPEHLALWIEVAAEHNPIVDAWATDRAALDRLRAEHVAALQRVGEQLAQLGEIERLNAIVVRARFAVVDVNSDDATRATARAILGIEAP